MVAAQEHSSLGWKISGVGLGFLLGFIGTGGITIIAAMSSPTPRSIPEEFDVDCYVQGYKKEAQGKNWKAALGGGLVGTVVVIIVYMNLLSPRFK